MSFEFLRITSLYSVSIEDYYTKHRGSHIKYRDHRDGLITGGYALTDAYERELEIFGVKSEIIIVNDEKLQRKWAKENSVEYADQHSIVLEQVKTIQPTVIMLEDLYWTNESFIESLRKLPFVKVVFGHHCSPFNSAILKSMTHLDFVISCSPLLAKQYKANGIDNSYLIYHAFDNGVTDKLRAADTPRSIDISFTGSLMMGEGLHDERRELLKYLVEQGLDIQIYTQRKLFSRKHRLGKMIYTSMAMVLGDDRSKKILTGSYFKYQIEEQLFWDKIGKKVKAPVHGLAMYELMRKSKICLNMHGEVAGDYAANMRLFEATGMGACLVTDQKINMAELFVPDIECITYRNKEEAKEKLQWLLENPVKIREIAEAGRSRCLRDHGYKNRASQLNAIIVEHIQRFENAL